MPKGDDEGDGDEKDIKGAVKSIRAELVLSETRARQETLSVGLSLSETIKAFDHSVQSRLTAVFDHINNVQKEHTAQLQKMREDLELFRSSMMDDIKTTLKTAPPREPLVSAAKTSLGMPVKKGSWRSAVMLGELKDRHSCFDEFVESDEEAEVDLKNLKTRYQ